MDDFEHRVHVDSGRVRYPGQEAIARLRAEVERLTAVVKAANAQAEHFERQWYLRGDEVEALRAAAREVCEWADAAQWALGNETGVPAAKLDALRAAIGVEAAQGDN